MTRFRSLTERQLDRAKAREKLAYRVREMAAQLARSEPSAKEIKRKPEPNVDPGLPESETGQTTKPDRPWAHVRSGDAPVRYQARTSKKAIVPHPWTRELVNTLLDAANEGEIALCLIWPVKLTGLPLLHALTNIERMFARDMRGLRTVLYPGNHACRAQLQGVLVDRGDLNDLFCSLWVEESPGTHEVETYTASPAVLAVLMALNDITHQNNEIPNPSFAELVPTFMFDPSERRWKTSVSDPLQRTMSKVKNRAMRHDLGKRASSEWRAPDRAPGALMVVHNTARRDAWSTALSAPALKGDGRPELLLLDATEAATRSNYRAVEDVPELIWHSRQSGLASASAVVVTDDPKRFFLLRARLAELKLHCCTKVWAAEADSPLISPQPAPLNWQPTQRSNSNFSVSIVDRDASQVALRFQRLTSLAGSADSPAYQALLQACIYVLRLSNMPAGYTDLTAAATETDEIDYNGRQNAWTPVKLALVAALSSGALNQARDSVEKAIAQAEQLIDDWNDATPMASRVLAEVRKHAFAGRHSISLVLPNSSYVLLAHRFLQRKLEKDWGATESLIQWHTLSSVGEILTGDRKSKHFAFIGINSDVLRVLLTHPQVPHGTAVLVAYRRAESALKTLTCMKEIEAFKAYRGRIGLLAQELERRLAEVPNPLDINKLREMPLTFRFEENGHDSEGAEQTYFKFELEGGGSAYASGWVYRHVPDEDPPFRRAAAISIQPGDFIFHMSDELRTKLESMLELGVGGANSVVDPVRTLLKLYHDDVQRRCALIFKSTKRSALAREIHAKMVELDPEAAECRPGRVYYWLGPQAKGDTRPHASKDPKFFKVFCKALGISDEAAEQHWGFVRNARRLNQYLGRELVARYAEILFHPESAMTYRKVPEDVILQLQHEALSCVYRVEHVIPPPARVIAGKKGETSAHPQ